MSSGRRHWVSYDADGNIVIHAEQIPQAAEPVPARDWHSNLLMSEEEENVADAVLIVAEHESEEMDEAWSKPIDESRLRIEPEEEMEPDRSPRPSLEITKRLSVVRGWTRSAMEEGIKQYADSLAAG